jgi:hypothetical protein
MTDTYDYDYENGIIPGDRAAVSFNYDARPVVPGEPGAGIWSCEQCGDANSLTCGCEPPPRCGSNDLTYAIHGCWRAKQGLPCADHQAAPTTDPQGATNP